MKNIHALKMINELSREEWGDMILTASEWVKVEAYASNLCVLAGEIAEYVGERGANGCGDSGHEVAINKTQKMRKKLRKTLGYSYP